MSSESVLRFVLRCNVLLLINLFRMYSQTLFTKATQHQILEVMVSFDVVSEYPSSSPR